MVSLNKIAIREGLESVGQFRQDSFVVSSNIHYIHYIHYPTNNSLVWDCIKESHRLLSDLNAEISLDYLDYMKGAKKTYFKINNTKSGDKRVDLFKKQLVVFTKTINTLTNIVKKKTIL